MLETIESSDDSERYIENQILSHMNIGSVHTSQKSYKEAKSEFNKVSAFIENNKKYFHHQNT